MEERRRDTSPAVPAILQSGMNTQPNAVMQDGFLANLPYPTTQRRPEGTRTYDSINSRQ